MKKIVLTYGLISGAIITALMWLSLKFLNPGHQNFDYGELIGYATMVIALSMIFFGIRSFRDAGGGTIGFWTGIQIGLLISLVCALCYGVSWEIYFQSSGGNFIEEYSKIVVDKMKEKGAPTEEIEKTARDDRQRRPAAAKKGVTAAEVKKGFNARPKCQSQSFLAGHFEDLVEFRLGQSRDGEPPLFQKL